MVIVSLVSDHQFYEILYVVIVIFLFVVVKAFISHRGFKYFSTVSVILLISIAAGSILFFSSFENSILTYNQRIYNYLIIPVLLYSQGFGLNQSFWSMINAMLIYAILGTVTCTAIIGSALAVSRTIFNLDSSVYGYIALGASLSPVDCAPALLSLQGVVSVEENLVSLVIGETAFNDPIALVIIDLVNNIPSADSAVESVFISIGNFVIVVILGFLIGFASGVFASFILRYTGKTPEIEPFLVFLFGMLSYYAAFAFNLSSGVATLTTAVLINYLGYVSLTFKGRGECDSLIMGVSQIAELATFAFIGIDFWEIFFGTDSGLISWTFVIFSVFMVLFSRFFMIFYLGRLLWLNKKQKIDGRQLLILCFFNTRGPVNYVFVHLLYNSYNAGFYINSLAVMMITILFTNLVNGNLLPLLIEKMNLIKIKSKSSRTVAGTMIIKVALLIQNGLKVTYRDPNPAPMAIREIGINLQKTIARRKITPESQILAQVRYAQIQAAEKIFLKAEKMNVKGILNESMITQKLNLTGDNKNRTTQVPLGEIRLYPFTSESLSVLGNFARTIEWFSADDVEYIQRLRDVPHRTYSLKSQWTRFGR